MLTLQEMTEMVRNSDITYEMSDDHQVWRAGSARLDRVRSEEMAIRDSGAYSFEERLAAIPASHLAEIREEATQSYYSPYSTFWRSLFNADEWNNVRYE